VLQRVLVDGHSLTIALAPALSQLDKTQDQAFVQAVCYGVCRYFHRLDFILSQLLDKPIKDNEIKTLALIGLYQLAFMRVKEHAAVSETIQAISKKKSWAKALLNALLRRYLREREIIEQKANTNPTALYSHPQWLIKQIENNWGESCHEILNANNSAPPLVLRLNTHKISREDYLITLQEINIEAFILNHCPSAIELTKAMNVSQLPYFNDGWVSVQDSSAQLTAELLELKTGQTVLDLCAAPGGKTCHILETEPNLKQVIAVDNSAERMARVRENLQRLHLNTELVLADATTTDWYIGEPVERILVDAPCSALGVIRRHPDIKLLRRADDISALCLVQKQILHSAWQLLAKGGILLYVTCSILKQENEEQIKLFLSEHDDAIEIPINADWGIARPHGRQILTGSLNQDGFYYAKLMKAN
jgi:16S rRNA (cytosine967-C5)-methyltransferase